MSEDRFFDFKLVVPEHFNYTADVVDAWAARAPDKLALVAVAADGSVVKLSFAEISERASRVANVLRELDVQKGDRVFVQLPRIHEWYAVVLGCFKIGAVPMPGTTQLVENDIAYRLEAARCRLAVTVAAHADALDAASARYGKLSAKILVGPGAREGWVSLAERSAAALSTARAEPTKSDDALLVYFTSGTTGYPKMALHTHASLGIGHEVTARTWHGLGENDLHWTVSDFGWAKAAWGKLFGQWRVGAALFLWDIVGRPNYDRMLRLIGEHRITSFCAPPTVYRMLVQLPLADYDWSHLRHATAAGEPLNPEAISIWKKATGLEIRDGYGQTETVCIVSNRPGMAIRQGSMGKPSPGWDVRVVDDDGVELPPSEEGNIAVRTSPRPVGLFKGYMDAPELDAAVFRHGWYYTGDRAYRDADGYFWFVGRADDVILSAGYRIGPFEVESALVSHASVVEAAAVGAPDSERGEIVRAFVVLVPGAAGTKELASELQDHVKKVTAPYKYPRDIVFVESLPKTVSGKIRRIELRQWKGNS